MKLKIGISMRITGADNYFEPRDSIAQDWPIFLQEELPDAQWIYLPNIGADITSYLEEWGINAFILSGGEDVGTDIVRDTTEIEILQYALRKKYPVLGVCRGLQLIYQHFGGSIVKGDENFGNRHIATKHDIWFGDNKISVNSFHLNRLEEDSIPASLKKEAYCDTDKSIEAVSGLGILGVMWHPERKNDSPQWNTKLIKAFFNYNT